MPACNHNHCGKHWVSWLFADIGVRCKVDFGFTFFWRWSRRILGWLLFGLAHGSSMQILRRTLPKGVSARGATMIHHMARYGTVRLFLALAGWLKGCRTQQFHIALGTQVLTKLLLEHGLGFWQGQLEMDLELGLVRVLQDIAGCASDMGISRGHLQPGALCSWCRSYNFQDLCFAS